MLVCCCVWTCALICVCWLFKLHTHILHTVPVRAPEADALSSSCWEGMYHLPNPKLSNFKIRSSGYFMSVGRKGKLSGLHETVLIESFLTFRVLKQPPPITRYKTNTAACFVKDDLYQIERTKNWHKVMVLGLMVIRWGGRHGYQQQIPCFSKADLQILFGSSCRQLTGLIGPFVRVPKGFPDARSKDNPRIMLAG